MARESRLKMTSPNTEANLRAHREVGANTLDPFVVATLKNISMISMQNCIYLNSANEPVSSNEMK